MGVNLKSAEEVEQYLKNLHIEYRFGCENEKNPEACHLLGDYEESISKDFSKAAQTYKDNCDQRNYPLSCRQFGGYAAVGKGLKKESLTDAYKYLTKGCDLGDGMSCTNAGIIATTKNESIEGGGPLDFPAGIKMLERGCDEYKLEKACYYLSGIYLGGVEGYVKKNMPEAYRVSLKACELGNAYACANISQMHARGDGVQKSSELAEAFKHRALAIQKELKNSKHIPFQQGAGS